MRMNTSKTGLSRMDSRGTNKSRDRSQRSGSQSSLFEDDHKKKKKVKEHPYDKIFGKHVQHHLAETQSPNPIRISWNEYKDI